MLKAILFDMGGVIIDSAPMQTKAFQEPMKEYASYPAVPYVTSLIKDLYDNSIKLAIASSSPMSEIEQTARQLSIADYFSQYVSGMDLKNPKPAPDIFLKAAQMLGVDSSECIVIEDTENGVKAAKAALMTCVGYYNPHSGKQDLGHADIVVEGFDEIDTAFLQQVYERDHNLPLTISTTDDLILRELTIDDAKSLYPILKDPCVNQYLKPQTDSLDVFLEKHKAYIESAYHFYGYGLWGIFLRSSNELIGQCGIQNSTIDGVVEYELGYLLRPEYQKRGYAYHMAQKAIEYAFESLELPRITAVIAKENQSSIKTALHLGMHYEKDLIHDGHECCLYVINRV